MVNKVIIIGRLGRDPEVRYTQGGAAVANFSVATSEKWKDKSGDSQERTEWHRVVTWEKQAEFAGQYLNKGHMVYVEGKLQTCEWQDKEGNKRQTTEIVAREVRKLSAREESERQGGGQRSSDPLPPPREEDDIPF